MYTVRDLMTNRVLYVTPAATVQAAMDLLRLQQLGLLPVVEEGLVVGLLDGITLYRYCGELPVREAMQPPLTIEADTPVGEAASLMGQHRMHHLVVTEDGRLIGMLTERDLLSTWGASVDPLTSLPWQDQLRRWAAGNLAAGREIAVLFIDMNQFGQLNKQHGHVTGDFLLKAVAATLKGIIDPEQETLCRYGGDEFAIATTRSQEEAWGLAEQIRERIQQIDPKVEGVRVAASIGVAGGKRAAPRPEAHPSATLDDLINLASRASTQAKVEAARIVAARGFTDAAFEHPDGSARDRAHHGAEASSRVVVEQCLMSMAEEGIEVTVALRRGSRVEQATVRPDGNDRMQSFAEAAAAALSRFLQADHQFTLESLQQLSDPDGAGVVEAKIRLETPRGGERLHGAVSLLEDRYRSAVNAVLDATNRRLGVFALAEPADGGEATGNGAAVDHTLRTGG
jgi:diguanylate cyclase (GGDEF)-like protein